MNASPLTMPLDPALDNACVNTLHFLSVDGSPPDLAITAAGRAGPKQGVQSLLENFDSATAIGNVEALVGSLASKLAKARPLAQHPNGQAAKRTLAQLDRRAVQAPERQRCG